MEQYNDRMQAVTLHLNESIRIDLGTAWAVGRVYRDGSQYQSDCYYGNQF